MSASKDMVGSIKKTNLFIYPAKVSNVVDGDTLDVSIQIWNDITIFKRVRLLGVDTPELHPREGTSSEKILEVENAKKSKEFTIQSTTGKMIYFATNGLVDSFGRSLGNIVWEDGGKAYNLGDELMKAGLAKNFKK
jgi:endonuclease YncB( thermonuclease family)